MNSGKFKKINHVVIENNPLRKGLLRQKAINIILFLFLGISVFAQNIPPITIHVEKAGTLPQLIAENRKLQITDLTLIGELNGTDIEFIRQMAGACSWWSETLGSNIKQEYDKSPKGQLKNLNIADAKIVRGGGSYYRESTTYTDGKRTSNYYYTKNDTISEHMFYDCNKLISIILPNTITCIESSAIPNSLVLISIPKSVTNIGRNVYNVNKNYSSKLISIHSENPIPPIIAKDTFSGVDKTICKLYVPKGSRDAYWLAWGFDNIFEE